MMHRHSHHPKSCCPALPFRLNSLVLYLEEFGCWVGEIRYPIALEHSFPWMVSSSVLPDILKRSNPIHHLLEGRVQGVFP